MLFPCATNRRWQENYKENIILMQNIVGTDLLQDLHFLFTRVILGNLKGLMFSGLKC